MSGVVNGMIFPARSTASYCIRHNNAFAKLIHIPRHPHSFYHRYETQARVQGDISFVIDAPASQCPGYLVGYYISPNWEKRELIQRLLARRRRDKQPTPNDAATSTELPANAPTQSSWNPFRTAGPNEPPSHLLIYAHPNAADIGDVVDDFIILAFELNIDVMLIEFSGYGLCGKVSSPKNNALSYYANQKAQEDRMEEVLRSASDLLKDNGHPALVTDDESVFARHMFAHFDFKRAFNRKSIFDDIFYGNYFVDEGAEAKLANADLQSEYLNATEHSTYADMESVLMFATYVLGIPSHQIILMGRSIGTGLTTQLATSLPTLLKGGEANAEPAWLTPLGWLPTGLPLAGLVLQCPFTSIADCVLALIEENMKQLAPGPSSSLSGFWSNLLSYTTSGLSLMAEKIVADRYPNLRALPSLYACQGLVDTLKAMRTEHGTEAAAGRRAGDAHLPVALAPLLHPTRLLLQHGDADGIVPFSSSEKLSESSVRGIESYREDIGRLLDHGDAGPRTDPSNEQSKDFLAKFRQCHQFQLRESLTRFVVSQGYSHNNLPFYEIKDNIRDFIVEPSKTELAEAWTLQYQSGSSVDVPAKPPSDIAFADFYGIILNILPQYQVGHFDSYSYYHDVYVHARCAAAASSDGRTPFDKQSFFRNNYQELAKPYFTSNLPTHLTDPDISFHVWASTIYPSLGRPFGQLLCELADTGTDMPPRPAKPLSLLQQRELCIALITSTISFIHFLIIHWVKYFIMKNPSIANGINISSFFVSQNPELTRTLSESFFLRRRRYEAMLTWKPSGDSNNNNNGQKDMSDYPFTAGADPGEEVSRAENDEIRSFIREQLLLYGSPLAVYLIPRLAGDSTCHGAGESGASATGEAASDDSTSQGESFHSVIFGSLFAHKSSVSGCQRGDDQQLGRGLHPGACYTNWYTGKINTIHGPISPLLLPRYPLLELEFPRPLLRLIEDIIKLIDCRAFIASINSDIPIIDQMPRLLPPSVVDRLQLIIERLVLDLMQTEKGVLAARHGQESADYYPQRPRAPFHDVLVPFLALLRNPATGSIDLPEKVLSYLGRGFSRDLRLYASSDANASDSTAPIDVGYYVMKARAEYLTLCELIEPKLRARYTRPVFDANILGNAYFFEESPPPGKEHALESKQPPEELTIAIADMDLTLLKLQAVLFSGVYGHLRCPAPDKVSLACPEDLGLVFGRGRRAALDLGMMLLERLAALRIRLHIDRWRALPLSHDPSARLLALSRVPSQYFVSLNATSDAVCRRLAEPRDVIRIGDDRLYWIRPPPSTNASNTDDNSSKDCSIM